MKSIFTKMVPAMAVLLLFVLLGGPQMAMAQAASPQAQNAQAAQEQTQPATTEQTGTTQPPDSTELPEAPAAQQPVGTPALPQDAQQPAQQNSKQQKKDQAPAGAAAAQKGQTAGGAASKPAGTAIAPAKQRQVRSMLLKLGMIAAGGAAIGVVYALSRGTSSVPPGSGR